MTDAVEKRLAIIGLLLGGDSGLFQIGCCRLIGEHLNRLAEPLTQLTHTVHLLAGRVRRSAIVLGFCTMAAR